MKPADLPTRDQVLAVTRTNKKVMAVMSWELYEGLLETVEVLSDRKLMDQLRKGVEDVKAGRIHSLSEAYQRLEL